MHVAHFIQRFPPALGGSEAYFARLSHFCRDQGDHVDVFTSNALDLSAFWSRSARSLPAGEFQEDGLAIHRFPCWRWPLRRYFLKLLTFFPNRLWQCLTMPANPICPGMWRAAKRHAGPIDLVHASAFPYAWPLVCARRLARRRGVPFVLTPFLHLGDLADRDNPVRRAYTAPPLRWLLHQADLIFAQTPGEREAMLEMGLAPEKVILQGLGVDPAECTGGDRERTRASWGAGPEMVTVGLLANQSYEKGSMDLLRAAERLWPLKLNFKVILAGPEMPIFQKFWGAFQTSVPSGGVVCLGPLDERQKRNFFAGLDLFVLPSRSDSFGLVLLEAWANGVPNIGYRAGGIADVIRAGADGFLVPCGDLPALAGAIQRLVLDPDGRRQMGQAGKERTARDFRWEDKLTLVREQYLRLWRRVSKPAG